MHPGYLNSLTRYLGLKSILQPGTICLLESVILVISFLCQNDNLHLQQGKTLWQSYGGHCFPRLKKQKRRSNKGHIVSVVHEDLQSRVFKQQSHQSQVLIKKRYQIGHLCPHLEPPLTRIAFRFL